MLEQAPDLAIEILSPGERPSDVTEQLELYRDFGTSAVVVIDPSSRCAEVVEPHGRPKCVEGELLQLGRFDDFSIDIAAAFAETD